jgi:hypothetical protein
MTRPCSTTRSSMAAGPSTRPLTAGAWQAPGPSSVKGKRSAWPSATPDGGRGACLYASIGVGDGPTTIQDPLQ